MYLLDNKGNEMPRTTVVRQRPQTALTPFDPIRYDPTAMPTVTVNSVRRRAVKPGDVIVARQRTNQRTPGEAGIALPRRDYAPVTVVS